MAYSVSVGNNYPLVYNTTYTTSPVYNTATTALVSTDSTISSFSSLMPVGVSTVLQPSLIDSGYFDDDPMMQSKIKNDIHYRFLDDWIYDDCKNLLRYLVVNNGVVSVVKNKSEKKNNNVEEASTEDNMRKSDFIEDNILTKETTKKILIKIIKENNIKWYNLPYNYTLVKAVMENYVKKKLKGMVN